MLGSVWIHDDPRTSAPTTAKFINLAGNSRTFYSGYYTCILDIAFDGNNYAWIIDSSGYVFISTQTQDKGIGGPVKNIGRIKYYPCGYSWGIAFDAFGYVYYGGSGGPVGWVVKAHMSTPLDTSLNKTDSARNYGGMASCAHPKVDISGLLA